MSGGHSRVTLLGHLTRDPEVQFLASGTAVAKFGIAINQRFLAGDGEWRERPTFIDVTIFGKRGEAFARFHRKGQLAFLDGDLRMDRWDDKQTGAQRSKLYVVAEKWEFVSGKGESPTGDSIAASTTDDSPQSTDETPF